MKTRQSIAELEMRLQNLTSALKVLDLTLDQERQVTNAYSELDKQYMTLTGHWYRPKIVKGGKDGEDRFT